jgi:FkbM family methyltransferase
MMKFDTRFNELVETRFGWMICNKFDQFIGRSLKEYGEFSYQEIQLLSRMVPRGGLVVEAGANVGAHTLPLAQHVGPEGLVLAFEPQRIIFQSLCGNVALQSLTNVRAMHAALGASWREVLVPQPDYAQPGNFGGVSLEGTKQGELVAVLTVDGLQLPRCDLIKADVEGMEEEVLRGAQKTIQAHRPVLYLESDRKEKLASLAKLLEEWDYDIYVHVPPMFDPNNYRRQSVNHFQGYISSNLLCVCKSKNFQMSDLTLLSK